MVLNAEALADFRLISRATKGWVFWDRVALGLDGVGGHGGFARMSRVVC